MQRLSIARAMMHDPEVLFLDEPSAGLDPQTRLLLWEVIREYNKAVKTILLTRHSIEEADALCHRIAIIDHGRIIAVGTPAELKSSIPGGYLRPPPSSQSEGKPTYYLPRLRMEDNRPHNASVSYLRHRAGAGGFGSPRR